MAPAFAMACRLPASNAKFHKAPFALARPSRSLFKSNIRTNGKMAPTSPISTRKLGSAARFDKAPAAFALAMLVPSTSNLVKPFTPPALPMAIRPSGLSAKVAKLPAQLAFASIKSVKSRLYSSSSGSVTTDSASSSSSSTKSSSESESMSSFSGGSSAIPNTLTNATTPPSFSTTTLHMSSNAKLHKHAAASFFTSKSASLNKVTTVGIMPACAISVRLPVVMATAARALQAAAFDSLVPPSEHTRDINLGRAPASVISLQYSCSFANNATAFVAAARPSKFPRSIHGTNRTSAPAL
mmetsp:Transcript_2614/g.6710  ORF Transcript_2614/g.6710 Transcript_2614/m.6710 type:complete len:298 (+) Transcript_2614:584-1477(+)